MGVFDTRQHGNRCTCKLLAEAMGFNAKTIRFEYCREVLMKHWRLECNHGCQHEEPEVKNSERWRGLGPIDPIKAILMKNE
jgi:hypothetical protein